MSKSGLPYCRFDRHCGIGFCSLIFVFKFLNNEQSFKETVVNVSTFIGEQVDPFIGIGHSMGSVFFITYSFLSLRLSLLELHFFPRKSKKVTGI